MYVTIGAGSMGIGWYQTSELQKYSSDVQTNMINSCPDFEAVTELWIAGLKFRKMYHDQSYPGSIVPVRNTDTNKDYALLPL